MGGQYEELAQARFLRRFEDGADEIVIPARHNWFMLPFLCFWIAMWTVGGFAAIGSLSVGL